MIDIPDEIEDLDATNSPPDGMHNDQSIDAHTLHDQSDDDEGDNAPDDDTDQAPDQTLDDHAGTEHALDHHTHSDGPPVKHHHDDPGAEPRGRHLPDGHQHGELDLPHRPSGSLDLVEGEGSFEHFDPKTDAGSDVVGNPADDMTHWHKQHYENTCNVTCEEFILDAVTGRDFHEEDLTREAFAHGWYNPRGGTPPIHVGELLEAHGVPIHRDFGCTFDALLNKLQQGEKIIVGVQSESLLSPGADDATPLNDYMLGIPSQFGNHAVEVIGVKGAGTDHPMLILNDPGRADGRGLMVPAEQFEHAWAPSGHLMVSTALHEEHAPVHDDPRFGGYYNADGTYHYSSDNTDRDSQTGATIRRW